jgi:hypothetical protein
MTVAWEHQEDSDGVIEFVGPHTGRVSMLTSDFVAGVIIRHGPVGCDGSADIHAGGLSRCCRSELDGWVFAGQA